MKTSGKEHVLRKLGHISCSDVTNRLCIERVKLDQCQVHLDLDPPKFVDLHSVGLMPRYINGHSFGFLVWLSASGDG